MFHISMQNHGPTVTFSPRKCSLDSIETPRICVAPTLAGCLSAIKWMDVWSDEKPPIHVYQAVTDEAPTPCSDAVPDRSVTDEHWYLQPTLFVLVNIIEPDSVLYQKLEFAAVESWSGYMDRIPCACARSQRNEAQLVSAIFDEAVWGEDNIASAATLNSSYFGEMRISSTQAVA